MRVGARACLWITPCLLLALSSSGVRAAKRQHLQHQHEDGNGEDGDGAWSESVARARCASRCLGLYSVHTSPAQNNGSLGWCQNHRQCSTCLEPCRDSWEMKRKSSCTEMCERVFPRMQWECVGSCEFLRSALSVKQGRCPSPEKASGFAAACVESCDRDQECPVLKRCCPNGCGHTCQTPTDTFRGVPLKPRKELSLEELQSGQLKVRWSSRFNISAEPVVYVLQRRWNYGIQPSEDSATSWEVVAQTSEQGVRLSDTRPGRWYQFRVAAVNSHGTKGFTTPSRHIHSRREPSSPPAPSDLRMSNLTFGPGRAVSARLQWDAPLDLDVPVHHYRVAWSWTTEGQRPGSSLSKRRKTVRETFVDLDNMRSNRTYTVEVQSVSYWGQNQLKGPRAQINFSTHRSPGSPPRDSSGDALDVGTPFYQDGQLRVHVYWQKSSDPLVEFYQVQWGPEHCSHNQTRQMEKTVTQESFVSLSELLFSCKYRVVLQTVGRKTRSKSESARFFTPSCAAVQAKSLKPISCSRQTAVAPQKLFKALNLTAAFDVRGGNVTAFFSWSLPTTPERLKITGSQVTWAEVVSAGHYGNSKPSSHSLISQSQILPTDVRAMVVSGLRPGGLYRLDVQLLSADREGPVTSRTFQTPLRYKHQSGPRLRKHHQQQPIIERH